MSKQIIQMQFQDKKPSEIASLKRECDFKISEENFNPKNDFFTISENGKILFDKIKKAAMSNQSVLLLGESGCGKTYAARLIHNLSIRKRQNFVDENISELSENSIESALFGVTNKTFTDVSGKIGFFEYANKGTLFLDEIGEIDLNFQKKLLKVVETKEFRKLGSNEIQKSDVRLIFATNVNLLEKIEKRTFRHDLFYRIAQIVIQIPPLRERREDIPKIVEYYMKKQNYKKIVSDSVMQRFLNEDWKGNIRQLQFTIDRAVFNADNRETILMEDIEIF